MAEALVDNASSSQQIRKAKTSQKRIRARELADLKAVLSTGEGRRLVWRLIGRAKTFRSVYDDQPHRMAFNAGQQDFGHFLVAEVEEARPDALGVMMKEHSQQT